MSTAIKGLCSYVLIAIKGLCSYVLISINGLCSYVNRHQGLMFLCLFLSLILLLSPINHHLLLSA